MTNRRRSSGEGDDDSSFFFSCLFVLLVQGLNRCIKICKVLFTFGLVTETNKNNMLSKMKTLT